MNKSKQACRWYIGLFLLSVVLVLVDAPLSLEVKRYVSRTYLAYLHALYLTGVFSLVTALLLCKNHVGAAVKSKALNSVCLAVSLLLLAAVWLPIPVFPGLPGSNSLHLSVMLATSCAVDLIDSFRQKK